MNPGRGVVQVQVPQAEQLPALRRRLLPSPAIVAALLLGSVFLLRLPAALIPHELNVDESQAISEGMKFLVDSRPWIAVDGQSCGPLHSYLITAFLLLGVKPGFVLAHVLANVLVSLQVLVVYLTLRRIASKRTALLGGLLMVFLYGFATRLDYLHYAGELLPSLCLVIGFYVFVLWLGTPPEHSGRATSLAFLGGLALGAAPWCKLQAAPIGGALGLVFLVAILRRTAARWLETAALLGGAVLTTCIILASLLHSGALQDFWYSYILANLQYATSLGLAGSIEKIALIFRISPVNQLLLAAVCVFVYMARTGRTRLTAQQRWAWGALLLYLGSAVFAVCKVHYSFPHHTIFLIAPMTYLVAMAAAACDVPGVGQPRQTRQKWLAAVMVCLLALTSVVYATYAVGYFRMIETIRQPAYGQVVWSARVPKPPPPELKELDAWHGIFDRDRITAALIGPPRWTLPDSNERIFAVLRALQTTRPVHTLVIWGWAPGVYVLSGMPSVTRDSNAYFLIQKGPLEPYFRSRYLADLRANPPDEFVDALTPDAYMWPSWTKYDGYEAVAELRTFVPQNYVLVDEVTLEQGAKPVRFFLRRGLGGR